jgi:hypothetical protein
LAVSTKNQKKASAKREKAAAAAGAKARTGRVTGTQLPRPRVTEFAAVAVVPVFPGTVDKPAGSRGLYDIVFVLGVPGVSSVTTSLDFDVIAAGGDSLLQGSGSHVQLESSDGQSLHAARILANKSGRLAQIRLTVTANDFSSAENEAFDAVMPTLSRMAFAADTPLEVTAISLTEQGTQVRQLRTTVVGAVQAAPGIERAATPELRMLLAAYREGLNGNSPLYQALSFYKILEGAAKFHTNRVRAARKRGDEAPSDPMARQIPADPEGLVEVTVWSRDNFIPYLGKSFAEIRDAVTDTIRHAVAHIQIFGDMPFDAARRNDLRMMGVFDAIMEAIDEHIGAGSDGSVRPITEEAEQIAGLLNAELSRQLSIPLFR